jgi:hypothetical protein
VQKNTASLANAEKSDSNASEWKTRSLTAYSHTVSAPDRVMRGLLTLQVLHARLDTLIVGTPLCML